jgi:hypothetical protein
MRAAGNGPFGQVNARLLVLRALWVALAFGLVTLVVVGTIGERGLCTPEVAGCTEAEAAAVVAEMGLSPAFVEVMVLVLRDLWIPLLSVAVSGLLFWRKRDSWLPLVTAAAMVLYALYVNTDTLERGYLGLAGQPLPAPANAFLNALSLGLMVVLFLTFPDGRFVPRWAWPLAIVATVTILAGTLLGLPELVTNGPMIGVTLLGLAGQLYRYRYLATPVERQQSRLVLLGLAGWLANAVIWFVAILPALQAGPEGMPALLWGVPANAALVSLLPISLTVAMLRYRLWDINVVIRKTLVYGLLTGLLALVYLGSVLILQALFGRLAGEQSPIIIVISTLFSAALFSPLRRRLQAVIDRRFFRQGYDAQQVLAEFAATARDETDAGALSAALTGVVEETMQPESVSVWLRNERSHGIEGLGRQAYKRSRA